MTIFVMEIWKCQNFVVSLQSIWNGFALFSNQRKSDMLKTALGAKCFPILL